MKKNDYENKEARTMGVLRYSFFFSVLALLAFHSAVLVAYSEVSDKEAASAITGAEKAVASAFTTVLEAEQAGAEVSKLLIRLSDAAKDLSKAEISYRLGDYEAAASFSANSSEICQAVTADAEELRLEALGSRYMEVWQSLIASVLGVIVVGIGSFWAWRVFKRRHFKQILGMKAQVSSDES